MKLCAPMKGRIMQTSKWITIGWHEEDRLLDGVLGTHGDIQ